MSDHAATYLNQWNSGRAALPSSSNGSAVDVPARQLDHPRSPVPALHSRSTTSVHDTVASGTEEVEAAEASSQALSAPKSVTEAPRDVDVVMGGPEVEILEDDESRRSEAWALQNNPWTAGTDKGTQKARARAPEPIIWLHAEGTAEKHQRGEKQGERKTSKEQKASGDVDVVDARKRIGKGEHSDQMDDDGSDVEITSWSKLDSNKTTGQHGASNARAKGIESGRKIKKGVAYVKNSEGKGQKHVE